MMSGWMRQHSQRTSTLRPLDPKLTARRILKVNHAGEFGAIRIYGAQIAFARRFYPGLVPALADMRDDEIEHCRLFREAMPSRQARPCRIMALWSLGGYVLGAATAMLGPNMVWICTEAVEATVHRHLEEQLGFLRSRDGDLHDLIASIQKEELEHLQEAENHQKPAGMMRALAFPVIAFLTEMMIWLSTWGDSTRMKSEIDAAA
jgi:ubiquinone biosynthesis monooxygenase Coq7